MASRMACIGHPSSTCTHFSETHFMAFPSLETPPGSYLRAQRPARIPPNCSLSLPEAKELVRTRIQQPLFPPPNPDLLRDIRPVSPAESDSENSESPKDNMAASGGHHYQPPLNHDTLNTISMPPSIARDPHRRNTWAKPKVQCTRDQSLREPPPSSQGDNMTMANTAIPQNARVIIEEPKPKLPVFVKRGELKPQLGNRVDTPHPSELSLDDDLSPKLKVEELAMGGQITMWEKAHDRLTYNPARFKIANNL